MATTADEVWQLLGELIQSQKETERLLKEQSQKTDRQIQELGKQIGGLGKNIGSLTEGLALPSMETILYEKFAMEVITPSVRVSKQRRYIELDGLAYANG